MKKEKAKRIAKRITAFAAAAAMAATFTFPTEIGEGFFDGFGNAIVASAAEVSGDYKYTVTYGKATITKYNGTATEITIPSELGGYPVTSIGNFAFSECTGLTSVIIPNSVTRIGSDAFNGCTGLTSITIPNSVTSIGTFAFYKCTGLTSITIPNSVTSIGWDVFSGCTGLTSITIPNSVTYIGDYAFSGCTGLTSITIPNSVTKIEDGAFKGCTNLTSITIPDSVTFVGSNAFYETGFYNDESNWENDILYIGNYLINSKDSLTSAIIKDGTVLIADSVFKDRTGLTSVTIPNSVTSINDHAFLGCTGLTSVTIGNSVTSIGYQAFKNCTGLTSITIPNSVTSIDNSAFRGCINLTSITIGNGITTIGPLAFDSTGFYNDGSNWGNDILYIGNYLIDSKNSLTSAEIKDGTVLIADEAFRDCTGLTSVTIPNSVTSIGNSAFYNCTGLTSVTIPNSVTSIGASAFNSCTGLTSVIIPNSVTSIGNQTFMLCTGLTSVTIPNSVTSIGNQAFILCTGLTSVTIPNSVTSIGDNAFYGCRNLTSIFLPNTVDVSSAGISGTATQIKYTVDSEGNVTVTDISIGSQTSVTIPETIDGKPVTVVYIKDGATGIDVPASATQIKYTVDSERTVINEVKLGTSQTDCSLPATLFEKPVYLADASLETCPTVTHDHREKTAANCTEKPICAICVQEYDEAPGHDHSGDWQKTDTDHWKVCTRSGCTEILDKNAHDFDEGKITTDPTEETEGIKTFTCKTCGHTRTEPVAKLDHTHKPSTEYSKNETGHWHICSGCDEKVDFEKHTEDSGTVTKEPTETTEGEMTYKCTKCGYVIRTDVIAATGHTHSTTDAYTYDASGHWHICSDCNEKVDFESHSYGEGVVTKQPTESAEGIMTYTCTKCGYVKTEAIPVIEADEDKAIKDFVERLYVNFLGRGSDPVGKAKYVKRLTGDDTASNVAKDFILSSELKKQGLSNEEFVRRVYVTMLNRNPDPAGLAKWTKNLDNGCSYASILQGFCGASEFTNLCKSYGVNRGTYKSPEYRDQNVNLTAYVSRMYTVAMGRNYDVTGLNNHTRNYLTGVKSAEGIAHDFIFSPEFKGKNLTDEQFVECMYNTLFGRPSDAAGKNGWLTKMKNGMTREQVFNGFTGSAEFKRLVGSFGI